VQPPDAIYASPLTIDFGMQTTGSGTVPVTVTIRNYSQSDAAVISVGMFGPGSNFTATTACPSSLPAGGDCTVQITFAPASAGVHTASLPIFGRGRTLNVHVTGTLAGPTLSVDASQFDFGGLPIGSPSPIQHATLRNTGPITLTGIALAGNAPGFGAAATGCNVLAPGAACNVAVAITPTVDGPITRVLTLTSEAGVQYLTATVAGMQPAAYAAGTFLSSSPYELDFGPVPFGEASPRRAFTFSLSGGAALTVAHRAFVPPLLPFDSVDVCPAIQQANIPCTYSFVFLPTTAGDFSGTATVLTGKGPRILRMRGTGVAPLLYIPPRSLEFGPTPIGVIAVQTVTVRNPGPGPIESLTASAPGMPFGVVNRCLGGLPAGASCDVVFSFAPASLRRQTTAVVLHSAAGDVAIRLQGGDDAMRDVLLPLVMR
jgi:hypothetical protein